MTTFLLVALSLLAAPVHFAQTPTTQPTIAPSPVARIVITPANPIIVAGDTLRLTAIPLDTAGRRVTEARVTFTSKYVEDLDYYHTGAVDSLGLVRGGTIGPLVITVTAIVPGGRTATKRAMVVAQIVAGAVARLDVSGSVPRMLVGDHLELSARTFSAAGEVRSDVVRWHSSDANRLRIDSTGRVMALAPGDVVVRAAVGGRDTTLHIDVVRDDIASLELISRQRSARQGDVIRFTLRARDGRGREIGGLTPRWSLAGGQGLVTDDGAFVGYDVGHYAVTARLGAHATTSTIDVVRRDVRRPPVVLGRVPTRMFTASEIWVHPGGRYAYLGTAGGGDRFYAIDVHDATKPVITDSLVVDTRIVNDLRTTPDGRFLVFTREGASTRRDGIVIASLADPAHPKVVAEFTDGVTSGVHSIFIDSQPRYGTHLYLTNDGTGAIDVIDVNDPLHPRRVASWALSRTIEAGRTVHDIEVRDGLLYASYWADGLVILDIGDGRKGGSPSSPRLVTQFRYDLDSLYRDAIDVFGPDYIRGTHTAWPHGKYIFVADEVFTNGSVAGAPATASFRTYSRLHVLDASDLEHLKEVAWYEPEYGGVHNLWTVGDTLYMGAYEGGFRAFDVSGELAGDLRAQHREIAHLHPAARDGVRPNGVFTWGVVVRDGIAYVSDMFSGLWLVRLGASSRQ
ncbi:MAG TPA: hypothetical protein VGP95_09755 [Gemmatimonadaceae bacterium]|jgi:hypothetical protein|nr:hypothetical protein [Gemmatimonadaceae bacterium]